MSQSATQDVFNNTPFASGTWGSGGFDGVGFYTGGSAGTGTATLTGIAGDFGDLLTANINGNLVTLCAYAELADGSGVVLTSQDFSTFYVFMHTAFDPGAVHALNYGFGTFAPPCFAAGTRIATERGEVAVEALCVGDRVVALRGLRFAPVTWIGHRSVACRHPARGREMWPIRVAAGAFAADMPHRDLYLSPDHAVYAEGALVPVRTLLNGATIVQTPVDSLTYWHVELASHDVLLAEGLAVESYLDTGNRRAFDNGGDAPSVRQESTRANLSTDPAAHARLKRRLLARATALGHATTDDPDLALFADGARVAARRAGFSWQALLPAGTRDVRLVSRTAIPGEILADGTDPRRLGVAVTSLALDGEDIPPGDPRRAAGWHVPEPTLQWTDGAATLMCDPGPERALSLHIAPLLRYWLPAGHANQCAA